MKASDTILSDEQIAKHQLPDGDYDITGLLQSQAKDSFKAGYDEGRLENAGTYFDSGFEVGKQKGRGEVVEWINRQSREGNQCWPHYYLLAEYSTRRSS